MTATASYLARTELLIGRPYMMRTVRLLVDVAGLSGKTYPAGTDIRVNGTGSEVEGFIDGDWLSLYWWQFAESPPANLSALT